MAIELRGAGPADLEQLSAIALRSKAYWGYDEAFMAACRAELTVAEHRLQTEVVVLASAPPSPDPVGYFALQLAPPASELMDLFVDPPWIGQGVGSALWGRMAQTAIAAGARWVDIEADPNAAPWYQRQGAAPIGSVASRSVPGRHLPLLRLQLGPRRV